MRIQDKEEQSSLWHRTGMSVPHLKTSGNGEPPGNTSELETPKLPCGGSLMIETAPGKRSAGKELPVAVVKAFWEADVGRHSGGFTKNNVKLENYLDTLCKSESINGKYPFK